MQESLVSEMKQTVSILTTICLKTKCWAPVYNLCSSPWSQFQPWHVIEHFPQTSKSCVKLTYDVTPQRRGSEFCWVPQVS